MSNVLLLSRAAVFHYLPMAECLAVVDRALREVSAGRAIQPVRTRVAPPTIAGTLGLMPGYLEEPAPSASRR